MSKIDQVLRFFEESGKDDEQTYYDNHMEYVAYWDGDIVFSIGVSHDGERFTIHTAISGVCEASESDVLSVEVFKLTKVY